MRIAIWGAGGIGCYYGARLQQAGHEVIYIARGAHLEAMQQQGLKVIHETLQFDQPVVAMDQQQWLSEYQCRDFDLIIIALKANVTAEIMQLAADWLKQGSCPVLSLQNGVENEALIASVVGEARTLGGLAVRIGGHIQAPGVIEARGVAQVVFGFWPQQPQDTALQAQADQLAQMFTEAAIDARLSPEIQRELWRKLLINNGVNPLSALTGLDTRQITSHPVYTQVVYTLMEEVAKAAQVEGVTLNKTDVDEMYKLISEFDAIKTSMLVDREKGRPLELDGITGAVLRRCPEEQGTCLMTAFISSLLQAQYPCS